MTIDEFRNWFYIVELQFIAALRMIPDESSGTSRARLIAGPTASHPERSEGPHNRNFEYTNFIA